MPQYYSPSSSETATRARLRPVLSRKPAATVDFPEALPPRRTMSRGVLVATDTARIRRGGRSRVFPGMRSPASSQPFAQLRTAYWLDSPALPYSASGVSAGAG